MISKIKTHISNQAHFSGFDLSGKMRRRIGSLFSRHALFFTIFTLLAVFCSFQAVSAQKRDHLTTEEDSQIREAQELDSRMKVLVRVIERRLIALSSPDAAQSKQIQKDSDKWGELRTGTISELFFDIQRTLDEAINKIDDVAATEQKNPLFSKAVHVLSEGCQDFTPRFRTFIDKTTDPKDRALITNSIESCNQIIEASGRVPKEEPKPEKKKKN